MIAVRKEKHVRLVLRVKNNQQNPYSERVDYTLNGNKRAF